MKKVHKESFHMHVNNQSTRGFIFSPWMEGRSAPDGKGFLFYVVFERKQFHVVEWNAVLLITRSSWLRLIKNVGEQKHFIARSGRMEWKTFARKRNFISICSLTTSEFTLYKEAFSTSDSQDTFLFFCRFKICTWYENIWVNVNLLVQMLPFKPRKFILCLSNFKPFYFRQQM